MQDLVTTFFIHYPRLTVPAEGIDILGGRLEAFRFEDFERLDQDWAHQSSFQLTEPTIWRRAFSRDAPSIPEGMSEPALVATLKALSNPHAFSEGPWKQACDLSLLIYYAFLTNIPMFLPDPRLSMAYSREGALVSRRIGPYERTFLLDRTILRRVEKDELMAVAAMANQWHTGNLIPSAKVFGPLRCLSLLGSNALKPVFGVAPLVVSLEGYLLGRKVDGGIANAICRQIRNLVGNAAPQTLDDDVRRIYAWRSDILHGRKIADSNLEELFWRLWTLTGTVVRHAIQQVLDKASNGNDVAVFRPQLSS
jgi:hypothetical protein